MTMPTKHKHRAAKPKHTSTEQHAAPPATHIHVWRESERSGCDCGAGEYEYASRCCCSHGATHPAAAKWSVVGGRDEVRAVPKENRRSKYTSSPASHTFKPSRRHLRTLALVPPPSLHCLFTGSGTHPLPHSTASSAAPVNVKPSNLDFSCCVADSSPFTTESMGFSFVNSSSKNVASLPS